MWQMLATYKVYLLSAATRAAAKETSPSKKGEQPLIGNYTPHKYCLQIETGEGSNKVVARIELLTPRPFSSNICTRETVEGPNSKPVPASQFIQRPLLKQTSANPRCVFYAPFTPTSGFPTSAGLTQFYNS